MSLYPTYSIELGPGAIEPGPCRIAKRWGSSTEFLQKDDRSIWFDTRGEAELFLECHITDEEESE